MGMGELSGIWESRYAYSGGKGHHQIRIDDSGDLVSAESLLMKDGSELHMELTRDRALLGGLWREKTSPTGTYRGTIFNGHVDFVLDVTLTKAKGMWVGHNRDKNKVNSGEWTLEKQK